MDPSTLQELLLAIEGKDESTAAHTWRVVLYTRALAEAAGITGEKLQSLTYAAALHDVGKLEMPRSILTKPTRLTPTEFEIIKLHPVTGYARMVSMGIECPLTLDLIRYHHEQWNGAGYPYGLAGDAIPRAAQFFSVIDTFDAMTSKRPYRQTVGEEAAAQAIEEIERGRETRYAPEAVDLFTALYRKGSLGWILHYRNDDVEPTDPIDHDIAEDAYQRQRFPSRSEPGG